MSWGRRNRSPATEGLRTTGVSSLVALPGTRGEAVGPGAPASQVLQPALGSEHPLCAKHILVLGSSHDPVPWHVPGQGGSPQTELIQVAGVAQLRRVKAGCGGEAAGGRTQSGKADGAASGEAGLRAGRESGGRFQMDRHRVWEQPGRAGQRQVVGGDGVWILPSGQHPRPAGGKGTSCSSWAGLAVVPACGPRDAPRPASPPAGCSPGQRAS